MLSRPFTTLRSQKSRPSEAGEPSMRTTFMPRTFLAIDWPLRFMYVIVRTHQMVKLMAGTKPALPIALGTASPLATDMAPPIMVTNNTGP
jgi:hypothetical protein